MCVRAAATTAKLAAMILSAQDASMGIQSTQLDIAFHASQDASNVLEQIQEYVSLAEITSS